VPAAVPDTYMNGIQFLPNGSSSGDDPASSAASNRQTVIDGTPARVAALGIVSLAVLVGLRWAGFKFNVTAGN
jgi:hypothetical protein